MNIIMEHHKKTEMLRRTPWRASHSVTSLARMEMWLTRKETLERQLVSEEKDLQLVDSSPQTVCKVQNQPQLHNHQ